MNKEELTKIIDDHKKWLNGNHGGIRADMSWANLIGANMSRVNLSGVNLSGVNLSGAVGLLVASSWIENNFKKTKKGIIVYKKIGNTNYEIPSKWEIKEGSIIEEVVNFDRCTTCGCGVNFGTKEWCIVNYDDADLWECLIEWEWLPGVCVPYNTDGKARCEKLRLIKKIK